MEDEALKASGFADATVELFFKEKRPTLSPTFGRNETRAKFTPLSAAIQMAFWVKTLHNFYTNG